jgi:hypothetical protein
MKKVIAVIVIVASVTTGCDDTDPLDEYLEVTLLENSVQVDVSCDNGGCETAPEINFAVRLEADDALRENDEIEFLQYRVDYTLSGGAIPFFASPLQAIVHNNSETVLSLQVAGARQRAALADRSDDIVAGTARLTLAGYDEKDEQVEFDLGFNIQFGDFVVQTLGAQGEAQ